jgi:hypothetical protein
MDRKTRQKLLDAYKDGYRVVAEALAGAPDDELDTAPAPGKWTARQIVHHLGDSEMTSAIRLRLLIAAPSPRVTGYDQEEFARRLYYDDRPTEAEWLREGSHSEIGAYSVCKWLEIYATHAHAHADQILVARDAARKARLQKHGA